MRSYRIKHMTILPALALASLALALPLTSQAASSPSEPAAPSVSTGGVGTVTGTSAVLQGSVNPHTLATSYYFKYGPTIAYGEQTAAGTVPGGPSAIDTVKVSATATGIQPSWHYLLVAINADGPKEGHDRLFSIKATTKKTKKPGFVLAKSFPPTPLGDAFVLDGTLTGAGNANRAIVLQASPYPYTAAYADVGAPILTGPTGTFSFHVAGLSSSTKFRVATASPPSLLSRVIPELVSVRVVLRARASGHKGLVRLYGTVVPAEVGAHVYFQLEKAAKTNAEKPGKPEKSGKAEEKEKAPKFATKFDTVVKHATKTISRFSAVVSIRDTGRYRAFVQLRPGPLASGTSLSILLHAPKKAKKHKG
jgi:hypothetical protein